MGLSLVDTKKAVKKAEETIQMKPVLNLGDYEAHDLRPLEQMLLQLALNPSDSQLVRLINSHPDFDSRVESISTGLIEIKDVYERINAVNQYNQSRKHKGCCGWHD